MEAFTWSLPQEIVGAIYAQVAIDDLGNIVIVWEDSRFIKGGVLKIVNGVFSFIEGPTSISTGGSARSLDFSMNGSGKAVAVWLEGDTVQTSTLQTNLSPLNWSAPISLSPTTTINIGSPQVAVDEKGNTLVIWYGDDENYLSYKFVEVVSQIDDSNWSGVNVLKEGTIFVFETPRIAVNGGIGAAVWNIIEDNSFIVEGAIAQIDNDSISWNKKTLSETTGISYKTQVVVTPSGRAVAIWRFFDQGNYKIQYINNSKSQREEWENKAETLSDSDVTPNGFQYVVAAAAVGKKDESDLVYAYWSDMTSDNPIHFSKSSSQNTPWSEGKLTTHLNNVGMELDATLFQEILQVIWWQNRNSIQVGYPLPKPPILQAFTLTQNNDLNFNPLPMIASNDKIDIIVAIWIEMDAGRKLLKGAYGQQSAKTSKMLMYWGVDEAFQSNLP